MDGFEDVMLDPIIDLNGSFALTDEEIAAYLANMSSGGRGDDLDQYRRDLITYYIMGVCGMTVCCFGLIGMVISLVYMYVCLCFYVCYCMGVFVWYDCLLLRTYRKVNQSCIYMYVCLYGRTVSYLYV